MFLAYSVRVWLSDSARDKNFDTMMRERADQLLRDAGDLRHANRSLFSLSRPVEERFLLHASAAIITPSAR